MNTRYALPLRLTLVVFLPMFLLAGGRKQLTHKQAEELVLNIPEALASKGLGGCPKADLGAANKNQTTVFVQVRNMCSHEGSGLIGNFTVDLKTGEIWVDVDRSKEGRNLIDSPHLKELRSKFFTSKKR